MTQDIETIVRQRLWWLEQAWHDLPPEGDADRDAVLLRIRELLDETRELLRKIAH